MTTLLNRWLLLAAMGVALAAPTALAQDDE